MPRPELQNLARTVEALLARQLAAAIPQLTEQIRLVAQSVLQPTLNYVGQSGSYALADAIVNVDVEVEGRGLDSIVRFSVQVQDANGEPHQIWHYLSGGTRERIQPVTVRFPERKDVRTSPGDLQARPFPGYTGDWVTLVKGRRVSGIDARNWYSTAAPEIRKRIESLLPSGTRVIVRGLKEGL